jgi:TonB family protein
VPRYNRRIHDIPDVFMNQGLGLLEPDVERPASRVPVPAFLIEVEPWHKIFLGNLTGQLGRNHQPRLELVSAPGKFWPDVFVPSRLPWARFLESICYHAVIIAAFLALWQYLPQPTEIVDRPVFTKDDVVYYSKSEYLPPIDTGGPKIKLIRKGEPELAKQPILSVPPDADNRSQTIVAPPQVKLPHDVPLPNVVATMPVRATVELSGNTRSLAGMNLSALPSNVIAPAPEIDGTNTRQNVRAPQAAVVEPAPNMNALSTRRLADINIAHSDVIAPAPQLPMSERRSVSSAPLGNAGARVVPPAPSMQGSANSNAGGRMIALGIHPVDPGAPTLPPAGNRRGTFAATPEGKAGAAGTPDSSTGKSQSAAGSSNGTKGIPPGLVVGAAPRSTDASTGNSRLTANATPPRVSSTPGESSSQTNPNATEIEKQVFGDKKFYSMTYSRGGSWVVHFAELTKNDLKGDLVAPVATKEVDPGYPTELMRRNVQGTVTLYAIIHNDGSVGEVRVLHGVDDRLDEYACAALAHWHFRPATKNGYPIDLEAVVVIPFRPIHLKGNF